MLALLLWDGDTLLLELTVTVLLELLPFPDTVIVVASEGVAAVRKIPNAKTELNNLVLI